MFQQILQKEATPKHTSAKDITKNYCFGKHVIE